MADPPMRALVGGARSAGRSINRSAATNEEREAAFGDVYRREWSALVALGWSLTGSWSTAEELAQDAFADAFRRWDEVGRLERPGGWVRRAIVNRSASHHRHQGVERRGLGRVDARSVVDAEGPATDHTGDRAVDRVGDPTFWAAVRSLPERQAAAVALHYLEDRPIAEIADVLDCRPSTVKVHLYRGRLALAKRLACLDGKTDEEFSAQSFIAELQEEEQ